MICLRFTNVNCEVWYIIIVESILSLVAELEHQQPLSCILRLEIFAITTLHLLQTKYDIQMCFITNKKQV